MKLKTHTSNGYDDGVESRAWRLGNELWLAIMEHIVGENFHDAFPRHNDESNIRMKATGCLYYAFPWIVVILFKPGVAGAGKSRGPRMTGKTCKISQ